MAYRSLVRLGMAYATYAGIRRPARRSGATDEEFVATMFNGIRRRAETGRRANHRVRG
jgi:hypothetical protein